MVISFVVGKAIILYDIQMSRIKLTKTENYFIMLIPSSPEGILLLVGNKDGLITHMGGFALARSPFSFA